MKQRWECVTRLLMIIGTVIAYVTLFVVFGTGTAKKQSGVAAQSMPAMNTASKSVASLFCDIKEDSLFSL